MDWARFELDLAARLSERSALTYRNWVAQWLDNGDLESPEAFAAFMLSEKKRGIADSTRNKYLTAAKHYCRFQKLTWELPKYTAEMNKRPDNFADDEIVSLLNASKQAYQCYFAMLAYLGARPTEIRQLNASDINLSAWYVTIAGTKTREYRSIPIPEPLRPYVTKHLRSHSGALFSFSDTAARMELARMCRQCGIPYRPPYAFRHSLITRLINSDVPLFNVMAIAGHKKSQTTEHYYKHNLDVLRKALDRDSLGYDQMNEQKKLELIKKHIAELRERLHLDRDFDVTSSDSPDGIELTIKSKPKPKRTAKE